VGNLWQNSSTTVRVSSRELLSTTRTSQSTEAGTLEEATLSRVLARLWQRLYVQSIAVIFIARGYAFGLFCPAQVTIRPHPGPSSVLVQADTPKSAPREIFRYLNHLQATLRPLTWASSAESISSFFEMRNPVADWRTVHSLS